MQELKKQVVILLSNQERSLSMDVFSQFLEKIERHGAERSDLQIFLGLLKSSKEPNETGSLLEMLIVRVNDLLEEVAPDQLTLEKAENVYNVNAATLRRACWSGKLRGEKLGGTWLVKSSDLEQYLAKKKSRTRKPR